MSPSIYDSSGSSKNLSTAKCVFTSWKSLARFSNRRYDLNSSHVANDDSYLNPIIFGLDYSNLLLVDTSMRLKKKQCLPCWRKVGLKYFSDIWRAWLLTWSPAEETSVSWKRNVSRAFQSYIPIEGANFLDESRSRGIPVPHIRILCPSERAENFELYFK